MSMTMFLGDFSFWCGLLAILFLGISLLTIFQAPTIFLWRLVILATEYGHWLLLGPVLLIVWAQFSFESSTTVYTIIASCLAIVLFLSPTYQAWCLARYLPLQLTEAYGKTSPVQPPFSLRTLWLAPAEPKITAQLSEFITTDGSKLKLNFYQSVRSGPRPCIIIIHGGGWNSGDYRQLPALGQALAASGYHVAAMNYRLSLTAVGGQWPAQKEDTLAALAYLRGRATELQIDPQQFVLMGRSAGGQIALATSYGVNDPGIRGCISLYAPTDMVFAYTYGGEDDILKSRGLIRNFMGGPLAEQLTSYQDASPRFLVSEQSPPTLLIHGTRDELVWYLHSHRLQTAVLAAHRPFFLLEMPWATHAFDLNAHGPAGQLSLYSIRWFLESVFSNR